MWERKNWQFWNDCNHLKVIKNVNHLLEKNFKKAELEPFTLYCRACPKKVEGNKQGRCRPEKKLAEAEIIVNWLGTIEYGLFWLNSHIQGWFSLLDTNSLTDFMVSLYLAGPVQRVQRAWNLIEISVGSGLRFFVLFGKIYFM